MRPIGINLEALSELSFERMIELSAAAGFSSMFTGTYDAGETERIAALMQQNGVRYDTIHAPFKDIINDMWDEGECAERTLRTLCDAVDRCEQVGVPIAVVHLSTKKAPNITDAGYRNFSALVEYAAKRGVILAFENQRWLANLAWVFEYLEAPNVRFCWDCGHEGCFTNGRQYMPLFAEYVSCLHVHDNNGEYNRDLHLIPFDGKLDFDRIARQIRESGFDGTLMLEIKGGKSGYYDALTPEEFLARAADSARRLCRKIDG